MPITSSKKQDIWTWSFFMIPPRTTQEKWSSTSLAKFKQKLLKNQNQSTLPIKLLWIETAPCGCQMDLTPRNQCTRAPARPGIYLAAAISPCVTPNMRQSSPIISPDFVQYQSVPHLVFKPVIVMQEIRRNLLYEVKKESSKRADPFFNPNSEDDDIRAENQRLRVKIRSQETEIIRLNGKINELTQQITLSTLKYNSQNTQKDASIKQAVGQFSKVPMILENKELKQSNETLNREILVVNGRNNELEAELRQARSDIYGLEMRIKELNILEKMREERFKDQVDKLTPIFIEEPQEYSTLRSAVSHLTKFVRKATVEVVQNLFMLGIKECEGNKKLNSFTVFNNYWKELKSRKSYGYAAAVACYRSLRKVMLIIDEEYGSADLEASQFKETIDEWIVHSVVEMKAEIDPERKLFRLLALKYRCKFPIKGEKWTMSQKVKNHLEDAICQEILRMLLPLKAQQPTD